MVGSSNSAVMFRIELEVAIQHENSSDTYEHYLNITMLSQVRQCVLCLDGNVYRPVLKMKPQLYFSIILLFNIGINYQQIS